VDEAVECFNKAIELSPSSTVTWWNKALLEDAAGRRGDAALSYSNFVEHALQFPDRYEQQLVHAGKRLDELMPALPLMPEPTGASEKVGPGEHVAARESMPAAVDVPDGAAAWSDRAYECLSAGDYDGAIECADRVLALNSRDELAWINKGAGLYNKAWIDHEAYKYDGDVMNKALSCFNQAIEINPHEPLGFLNKGLCLNDLKKYGEALACFNRALELDPKNAMAWCHKGNSYRASGRYKEAVACCDKAIELALSSPLPWYFKAVSLEALKNESEAMSCFRKFLEREPDRNSVLAKDARKRLAAIVGRVIQQSRQ
jgi:tetratricopeptide (TPR) repeat protein